jgi:hypothetical protein
MFLTESELVDLTGYRQPAKQVAHLKAQRIPFHTNKCGHPKVAKAVLEGRKVVEHTPSSVEIWVDLELRKRAKHIEQEKRKALKKAETARNLPALKRHHTAKRRAAVDQQLPEWADLEAIKAVYQQAREITKLTGVQHHVDHIIPLTGKTVSGLHVHNNLQVIPARENLRKHNRYEVEA